jgi:hypothetical protein
VSLCNKNVSSCFFAKVFEGDIPLLAELSRFHKFLLDTGGGNP